MMRIFTIEDVRDIYLKVIQRGYGFVFSKFSFSRENRTKSSFNETDIGSSNWWVVPLVRERWNVLITGNKNKTYEEYVSEKFKDKSCLKMLSIGSGVSSHEIYFATLNPHWEITCIDFSEKLLKQAEHTAREKALTNIQFIVDDIYKHELAAESYDLILFHSSLHHFKHLEEFIPKIHQILKPEGSLLINEYVGPDRMQYSRRQLKAINECLLLIDKDLRKIYNTKLTKNRFYGSGLIRMIVSDPSECVESEKILPIIHRYFKTREEKGYGGSLLMPVLKDISQNFLEPDERKERCLISIFEYEDAYLNDHPSDYVFGIYEKSKL